MLSLLHISIKDKSRDVTWCKCSLNKKIKKAETGETFIKRMPSITLLSVFKIPWIRGFVLSVSIYPSSLPFSAQDPLSSSAGASTCETSQMYWFERDPDFFFWVIFGVSVGSHFQWLSHWWDWKRVNPQLLRWIFSKYSPCPALAIWLDAFFSSTKTDCSPKWVLQSTQVSLGLYTWASQGLNAVVSKINGVK